MMNLETVSTLTDDELLKIYGELCCEQKKALSEKTADEEWIKRYCDIYSNRSFCEWEIKRRMKR